jgi:RimJ/RimL family protein N-acetyltransferase
MQFVDKAFARRLESCEEMPQVYYAREFRKSRPEVGAAVEEFCGGHMVFAGLGSPIGRVTGAGFDRPLTEDDLDRIEGFYREHKAPSQVDLTPMHEPAVFEMFQQRGYAIAELNNVLYRKLDREEKFPAPPAHCEVRRSHAEESEITGAIVESAFFPEGAPDAFRGLVAPLYQMENALAFVAAVEGKPVACGTGLVIREHRVVCDLWGGNAGCLSWTRFADGTLASAPGGCGWGRMRVRRGCHARRHYFSAECREVGIPHRVQQGDGDQATGVMDSAAAAGRVPRRGTPSAALRAGLRDGRRDAGATIKAMIAETFTLQGKHVRLERLEHRHIDGLVAASAPDPSLYRWSPVPQGKTEATAYVDRALAWMNAGTALPFAIVRVEDGVVLGSTRFWNIERWAWPEGHASHGRELPDACEIGYTWLARSAIRTAANTEAKLLMLEHAFEVWQVLRVSFHTDSRNERSQAALERIGGKREGILRAHRMAADFIPRDSVRYSIVAAEWPPVKQRLQHFVDQ